MGITAEEVYFVHVGDGLSLAEEDALKELLSGGATSGFERWRQVVPGDSPAWHDFALVVKGHRHRQELGLERGAYRERRGVLRRIL